MSDKQTKPAPAPAAKEEPPVRHVFKDFASI